MEGLNIPDWVIFTAIVGFASLLLWQKIAPVLKSAKEAGASEQSLRDKVESMAKEITANTNAITTLSSDVARIKGYEKGFESITTDVAELKLSVTKLTTKFESIENEHTRHHEQIIEKLGELLKK